MNLLDYQNLVYSFCLKLYLLTKRRYPSKTLPSPEGVGCLKRSPDERHRLARMDFWKVILKGRVMDENWVISVLSIVNDAKGT